MPCLKGVYPAWLLIFRALAFVVLLSLLIATALVDGGTIFFFYTQWTFTLVTIYFGLGSLLSMYGCIQYQNTIDSKRIDNMEVDSVNGASDLSSTVESSAPSFEQHISRKPAGTCAYIFQIIFQINAGAVMLTDCVFWFISVPFLEVKDYDLNFLLVNMHTINAVFLLGDTALNCLQVPLVSDCIFLLMDNHFCDFPVDFTCLCFYLVASPIS